MNAQIAKDIAELKPRILRAAGEMVGVLRPVPAYYTPQERLHEYLHIYAIRVGAGHDRDLDCVIRLYHEWGGDPDARADREAFTESVEAAIEAAEPRHAEYPIEP